MLVFPTLSILQLVKSLPDLQPEKCTPFGQSLPIKPIIGSTPKGMTEALNFYGVPPPTPPDKMKTLDVKGVLLRGICCVQDISVLCKWICNPFAAVKIITILILLYNYTVFAFSDS